MLGGKGQQSEAMGVQQNKPMRVTQRLVLTGAEDDARELYRQLKMCSVEYKPEFMLEKQPPLLLEGLSKQEGDDQPVEPGKLRIEIEVIEVDEPGPTLKEMLNFSLPPLRIHSSPHPYPEKLHSNLAHRNELIQPNRTWSVCCGVFRAVVAKLSPPERIAFIKSKGRGSILRMVKEASQGGAARARKPRQIPKQRPTLDWYRDLENHLARLNLEDMHETELRRLFNFLVSIRFKLYWELRKNEGVTRHVAKFFQGDNVDVEEGAWLIEQIIRWMVTQAHMVRTICSLICACPSTQ